MSKRPLFFVPVILVLAGCLETREINSDLNIATDVEGEDVVIIDEDAHSDSVERVSSCEPSAIRSGERLQDRFSLSLFHYNIQYVAGGGEKYENAIIRIGFEPILDILMRHPEWKFSIEMQGYMIELMAQRFPKTFAKLKELVRSCQVELISFHYSDQLFLAYPRSDLAWSFDLNRSVFEQYGIFPSGVVFTQEGQFGEGMLRFMNKNGLKIALFPKNLFRYFQGDVPVAPLYSKYDTDVVIVGAGVNSNGVIVDWSFFNDGELLATGGFSPYFVETGNYKVDEESIKKYEEELINKEKEGFRITSIGDYVATIREMGLTPQPLPALLDGTWQPDDTGNLHRWMGDAKGTVDRDNSVLTSNYKARKYVLALEKMLERARSKGIETAYAEDRLIEAKRRLAFAEVSDSTGWYPNKIEVEYSLNNSQDAIDIAKDAIKRLSKDLGLKKVVKVDTLSGDISEVDAEEKMDIDETCSEIPISEIISDYYSYQLYCKKVDEFRTDVRVVFRPINQDATKSVTMSFPFENEAIEYVPALMDDEWLSDAFVYYERSLFSRSELNTSLATGVIGLNKDLYLIKHCEYFHISPFINFDTKRLTFVDNSSEPEGFEWRFSIIKGPRKKAYEVMRRVNVYPVVYVDNL